MEQQNLVEIKDLFINFYTYDGTVKALNGIDLGIQKGEVLGLVGETGCGKSVTSLSVMSMVISPGAIEKGSIKFNIGEKPVDMLHMTESQLLKIRGRYLSMIFQEPRAALNPVYTISTQLSEVYFHHRKDELINAAIKELETEIAKIEKGKVVTKKGESKKTRSSKAKGLKRVIYKHHLSLYNLMLKNPKSQKLRLALKIPIYNRFQKRMKKIAKNEIIKLLGLLRIADPTRVADMYPHELSGGMAQRVVIAMALACNPLMLIADEPTTSLDVTVQAQILQLVKELREKFQSSILYVTHDLGVVAEVCDRVAVMYGGNIAELSEVMSLFKKPLHPYTQALLESIPRPGKSFVSIPGMVPSLINPARGCRFYDRCKYALEICPNVKPELIEVEKDHKVACHLYAKP